MAGQGKTLMCLGLEFQTRLCHLETREFLMTSVALDPNLTAIFYFFNVMVGSMSLGSRQKRAEEELIGPCCIKWKTERYERGNIFP